MTGPTLHNEIMLDLVYMQPVIKQGGFKLPPTYHNMHN